MTCRILGGVFLAVVTVLAGCGSGGNASDGPPVAFVSVPPQAWLVEQLAGPHFAAQALLPKGRDPHTYEPEPREVMALGAAEVYFRVGVPLEDRVLEKVAGTGAGVRIVDTVANVEKIACTAHVDGHDHGHDHGETDPHVWLGPPQLRGIAQAMTEGFVAADPGHAADYRARLADFLGRLEQTDAAAAARLAPHAGAPFFVYHPAFGYFAAAYGLEQRAVETGGREPTPRDIERLIAEAREAGVKVIFVQPQFPATSAEAVAEAIGGEVAPLDPMAPDVLDNITRMADTIASALESAS